MTTSDYYSVLQLYVAIKAAKYQLKIETQLIIVYLISFVAQMLINFEQTEQNKIIGYCTIRTIRIKSNSYYETRVRFISAFSTDSGTFHLSLFCSVFEKHESYSLLFCFRCINGK